MPQGLQVDWQGNTDAVLLAVNGEVSAATDF
jgi:hypothetical protein